jgi:hypothetical protein
MKIEDIRKLVHNGGLDPEHDVHFKLKDAIATPDATEMLKRTYTEIIQDVVQMELVGTKLIKVMKHDADIGESVTFRYFGAGNIPNVTRGEGGEYPKFSLASGQVSTIKAQFGQFGLVVDITSEEIEKSQWDVIRSHITEAGRALGRAKEHAIFQLFESQGVVVFDNVVTNPSVKGKCSGYDRWAVANGSITQEDLFDMYSQGLANGYNPNVILMHPLAFPIFQKDPILRNAGYNLYNPREYINSQLNPTNSYKNGTVDTWRNQQRAANGKAGRLEGKDIPLTSTGFSSLPSYSPLSGMNIVLSHFVPFDDVNQTTSVIMLDTNASGVLNIRSPLSVDSWDEMSREITSVRIKESYSLDVLDGGLGILVAKNVPLVPNEMFYNPQVVINDPTP